MTSSQITVGVDCRGGRCYVATVRHDPSGPRITALISGSPVELKGHRGLQGRNVVFSIPDSAVIVKDLQLSGDDQWDVELLARFELSQSLLDNVEDFSFAAVPVGRPNRCLGLITRHQNLEPLTPWPFSSGESGTLSPRYEMRAVALGKGYINFCSPQQGKLVCLVDLCDKAASISFVYGPNIVGVGFLPTERFDLSREAEVREMTVDLKTLLNFKMASLFEEKEAPPLLVLVVSGDDPDSSVMAALRQRFPMSVLEPPIDTGLLEDTVASKNIPLDKYLVAMGLAAN